MRRRKKPVSRPKTKRSAKSAVNRVVADMRRDPALAYTPAVRRRGLDPRWVRKHYGSLFEKDSSGRIRAKRSSRRTKTLYIPTDVPGVSVPVITRNKRERLLIGEWLAALNEAGRGKFARIRRFPKRQVIGGVRLATGPKEVQRILAALAEEESPYEGLYRSVLGSR